MFQRFEQVRTIQLREAELYRQLKHSFADVSDLLERIRWAVIGNLFVAFQVGGYVEYSCEPIGDALMFKIEKYQGLAPQQEAQQEPDEEFIVPL